MRKTLIVLGLLAVFTLAAVPAHAAVRAKGAGIVVKVKCKKQATPSPTTPPDSVYQGIYGSGSCSGNLKLTATVAGGKKIKAGKGTFSIAPGKTKSIKVKLTRKARRSLQMLGRLKVKVALNTSAPATAAKKLTIKPLKPAK
jgi:hypothetical protein